MNERTKNILLGVLIVGILSMTVAFAALTTRLNIGGSTNVAATKWNIRFENWTDNTTSPVTIGGQTHQNTASYPLAANLTKALNEGQDPNITKVSGITVTLNQPGDYASYKFEIANRGTIAAKLNSMNHEMGTTNTLIQYDVDCYAASNRTGEPITTNYVLAVDQSVYCTLFVQYKDQTNTAPAGQNQVYEQATAVTTNLTATWQWVQDDTQSSSNSGSGNEQSGGNEQQSSNNPYETTFNGTYTYTSGTVDQTTEGATMSNYNWWVPELNNNWDVYARNDGTKNEVCMKFSDGTVCLESDIQASDFADVVEGTYTTANINSSGLKGYTKAKTVEMLDKGALDCDINSGQVMCFKRYNDAKCYIFKDGGVSCYNNSSETCGVYYGGSVECY